MVTQELSKLLTCMMLATLISFGQAAGDLKSSRVSNGYGSSGAAAEGSDTDPTAILKAPPANPTELKGEGNLLNISGRETTIRLFDSKYSGVLISRLGDYGIAQSAGLKAGDVLLSVNVATVHSVEEAEELLRGLSSGNLEIVFARPADKGYELMERWVHFVNPLLPDSASRLVYPAPTSLAEENALTEACLITLVNEDRNRYSTRQRPLTPLMFNPALSRLAKRYALDMQRRNFFSHKDPDGNGPSQRAKKFGVCDLAAENILFGARNAAEAEALFMNEPADNPHNHRGNILNPKHRSIGIGVARDAHNRLIVVMEFAFSNLNHE